MKKYDGLQRTFSKEYTSILRQRVKQGKIENYLQGNFPVEEENNHVYRLQQQMHHNVILDPEKTDFENAKLFFDAYKDLSPMIASEEAFWTYLAHVEYFEYVKARWKIGENTSPESITDHFFVTSMIKVARNGLARLWWPMYMTYDEENTSDPYHLSKILYRYTDTMQMLSESSLFSCRNLIHAILHFFEINTDIPKESWLQINRYIIRYYNSVGGVRKLIYLDEKYFEAELQRNKSLLVSLPPRKTGVKVPLRWNI